MPIQSMTGFARAEGHAGRYSWVWEVRSVNGRGLDCRCRLPQGLESLDLKVRDRAQKVFARGSLQIGLQFMADDGDAMPRLNEPALERVIEALSRISGKFAAAPASLDGILSLKGVFEVQQPEESEAEIAERDAALLASLDRCLEEVQLRRRQEGDQLEKILETTMTEMSDLVAQARLIAERQMPQIAEKLKKQVADLLGEGGVVSEDRLAQEIALLASRGDVREELDRLQAHMETFGNLLKEDKANGRKLDFLMQEFNREANTLCSKSSDVALTTAGLELKTLIAQIREQVQNVE